MTVRLLSAVMQVCSPNDHRGPALIEDVVKAAGVSRGTFYKYFDSMEEALALLGRTLADEMTVGLLPVYDILEAPLLRTATGFQLFLHRGALDPAWAAFVAHSDHVSGDSVLTAAVRSDLEKGRASGDFIFESTEVALDFLLGATTGGLQRFALGRGGAAQVRELARMVLTGLGAPPGRARAAVDEAALHLESAAPGALPWWRPLA